MSLGRRVWDTLSKHHTNNVATLRRSPLSEISGSLGDLGTLLPIMIALAVNGSISLSSTLVFSGVWNILTGVAFGVPLTVQPMKVCMSHEDDMTPGGSLHGSRYTLLKRFHLGNSGSCHRSKVFYPRECLCWIYDFGSRASSKRHRLATMVYSCKILSILLPL